MFVVVTSIAYNVSTLALVRNIEGERGEERKIEGKREGERETLRRV